MEGDVEEEQQMQSTTNTDQEVQSLGLKRAHRQSKVGKEKKEWVEFKSTRKRMMLSIETIRKKDAGR